MAGGNILKGLCEPNKQDYKYVKTMWNVLHKLRVPELQEPPIENMSKAERI